MAASYPNRDCLLSLSDLKLLDRCRISASRGTGKGGQKRNKTESAIQLMLTDHPEITVSCDDTRSQQRNRTLALRRLRHQIALQLRRQPASSPSKIEPRPSPSNSDYPLWLAGILDQIETCDYQIGEAARQLNLSTGRLIRLLSDDSALWRHLNQERAKRNLKPLKK